MNFDIDSVVAKMLEAAKVPLKNYWESAEPAAKSEFTKIAQLVAQIGIDRTTQTITQDDAADRLEIARAAAKCALDEELGVATIATQDAINAALGSVSSIVNGYLGLFVL